MKGKTLQVLHGTQQEGACCVLVEYQGYSVKRCYCNPRNMVRQDHVHEQPLEKPVSCPVCEAYRQRLVRFWSGEGPLTNFPRGSDGQHA